MNCGKLLSFEINGRLARLAYEKQDLFLEFITSGIVRIGTSARQRSHAIENLPYEPVAIKTLNDGNGFSTDYFIVKFEDCGRLTFLTSSGEVIVRDAASCGLFSDKNPRKQRNRPGRSLLRPRKRPVSLTNDITPM